MYTKARIAKHPIHPMLIPFPIALYTSTVIALIVHAATGDPFWYRAAMWTNIAGVVMAAIAAIPGFVDLFMAVPAKSGARETGLRHAGFNVIALAFFIASGIVIIRNYTGGGNLADGAPLVLSILGVLSTVAAGWFGWTLTQTHHVGVEEPGEGVYAGTPAEGYGDLIAPPPTTVPPGPRSIEQPPVHH